MPAVGQGQGKLRLRPATACDLAFRSGHFRSKVPLLSGSHEWHITLASKMSCSTANFAKGSDVTGLYHSPEALARKDALAGTGCGRDARAPRQCRMRWGVEALPLSSGEREVRSKLGKGRGRFGFRLSGRALGLALVSIVDRPEPGPTLPTRGRGPMRKRPGTGGTWGGSSGLGPCRRFPGSASAETHPAIDGRP